MNRQEFAHLLSQTQSMMAPSRAPTPAPITVDSCHHCPASALSPPLSPRQRFQAHVRTLNDNTLPSRNVPTSPKRSELQHVSSLRVSYRESPSPKNPPRSSPTWRNIDLTLKTFDSAENEPYFITEEREAWSRPYTPKTTTPLTDDIFLQPHEGDIRMLQPSKQLRESHPFAPLAHSVGVNERPKTSRGPPQEQSSFPIENTDPNPHKEDDLPARASKFAEGSMNTRSAGVSSTWHEHISVTSYSGTESDDDPIPRASPQHSSIDVDEFKPEAVIAPTLKQRLFKFGTKARAKENTTRVEVERISKKKNGLRKSISLWNLHSDKKKTADWPDSPEKKTSAPSHNSDLDLLNDRKRRAEEAYAQQFGIKRRKSNVGLAATTGEEISEDTVATTRVRSKSKPPPNSSRRSSQTSSTTIVADSEWTDGHIDLDHQKRPTRRELEKENQQLRALLRQKQAEVRLRANTPQPPSPSHTQHPQTPGIAREDDASPPKRSAKKQSRKQSGAEVPPVPPLPERAALKTLSNTTNQPQLRSKGDGSLVAISTSDINAQPKHDPRTQSRRSSIVRGEGFPHHFSVILEEDEENGAGQTQKENQCTTNDIFSLKSVSEMKPGNRDADIGKMKVNHHVAIMQMQSIQKENWEWPDDVF
ncbi:uncharacterized protein Z519_11893 [Cladophialophora bantiana CBS 173.52]|uniref:Uncharacterized protein n=1 Tax=Cladophialophora bantiana (strain ATCC 10958 / CBS 173.52 / CDC B-1940 / NIH 8579) TaxID=1442370 RepID=A0A0D2HT23_CLAB1|nr:uncharacterized protein Z519_11893 [Cladophialophora bantiana CBS 173.52]KIW87569.1 hypothetical protein Z519_11893 [Cladophialophora bantiana CBS 173.52]